MKLRLVAFLSFVVIPTITTAQNTINKAYAITSETNGAFEWTEVKLVDLNNGEVIKNVFENNKGEYELFDGSSAKPITIPKQKDSSSDNSLKPFSGFSAACAYDAKSNRLYYAPLFINQLRYIDLNKSVPGVYVFRNTTFSNARDLEVEANHITRMAIASDGNGYALNNDGSHLVRFTTGKIPVVTDLGGLYDAPENGDISIKDPNTSWGGDMLSDASGNLYVITAHNHVFRINIQTRSAAHVTLIKDLPAGFTTNGAVVDNDGNIVLSSANFLTSYFKVDPSTWEATALSSGEKVYNTSDLANENMLYQTDLENEESLFHQEKISLYPNPVKSHLFRISFINKPAGKYNIQLMDIAGRTVSDKAITVYTGGQTSEVRVNPSLTKGMYLVKVLNHEKKEVFSKKIILQ